MKERIHLYGTGVPSNGATEVYDLSLTEQEGRPAVYWSVTWNGGSNANQVEDTIFIPSELFSYITPAVFGSWLKHSLLPVVSNLIDWAVITANQQLDEWCTVLRDCTECR